MKGADFGQRAATILRDCVREIETRCQALIAEHAAKGLLKSGATIKKALAIFEEETSKALAKTLDEAAKRIEHRGRKWDSAMLAIGDALYAHIASARSHIEKPLKLAGGTGDTAASRAVDERLTAAGERLRAQLVEFRDGWAAPTPRPWKDRHPTIDRLIFLLIGAIITAAFGFAMRVLTG